MNGTLLGIERTFDRMKAAPKERANAPRGLTRSLDLSKEGLAMNATRRDFPLRRSVNQDPAPELVEAVALSRFWRSIDIRSEAECWPWKGDLGTGGYGVFFYAGRRRGAHELALSFTTGEKRHPDLETCHSCDNPVCCNPAHLRFDTRQSNVDDMRDRDRNIYGSRSRFTKLTESQVLLIRERRALGARQTDLARDFNISVAAVSAIVRGQNWQHVGGPITNRQIARTRKAS